MDRSPQLPSAQEVLGALQYEVMTALWHGGAATVREVLDEVNTGRDDDDDLAYTTVMTVLSRLHERGLVTRRSRGRAYVYAPVHDEDDVAQHLGGQELRELVDRLGEVAMAPFVEALAAADPALLRKLVRLAEEHRGG